MSKRLKKRQQELEQLKAQEAAAAVAPATPEDAEEEEEEEDDSAEPESSGGPVNAFALLQGEEQADSDEDEDEVAEDNAPVTAPKKSKKKKQKKKKTVAAIRDLEDEEAQRSSASTPGKKKKKAGDNDPLAGMDEVDRALAELNIKYGAPESDAGPSRPVETSETRRFMAFRSLLAVDPKNLDADAELRRFFGSKVIASSAQSTPRNHRPGPSAKLRYTLSKAKPNYPPATSLAGLTMRELDEDDVEETLDRRELERGDNGEKWFTFEHSPAWREIERQFMGAVRSHDPNELMALLQVYPWHVDTLLQMSEVYRLQSDIGAASDYAERALYAFDRCLMPSFSVSSGTSRLDFDRVENRPMFTALHRIISYLGRRGCWVTAFNFAKLLFALDPTGDPHGAAFWLDFLAVKSGNGEWIISMLEQSQTSAAAAALHAYPGMAYAQALALRADEEAKKHGDHTESDEALRDAIKTFPQVVIPLADKIGASIPDGARTNALLQVQAGYTDSPSNVIHLLSHIYVARSEALWKEASTMTWLESQLRIALPDLDNPAAKERRSDVLALIQVSRDPIDEQLSVPLFICRHVVCSESTSWLGFLPPVIRNKPVHAYDPLPPSTAVTMYDDAYFAGVRMGRNARGGGVRGLGGAGGGGEAMEGFMERLMGAMQGPGWQGRVEGIWRELTGRREFQGVPQEERENLLQQLMQLGNAGGPPVPGEGEDAEGHMPGGFPGQDDD